MFNLSRPCKATFLCISRPEVAVYALKAKKPNIDEAKDLAELKELNPFEDKM